MQLLRKPITTLRDTSQPRWFDWTYFGIIAVLATFLFCQNDLHITAQHSYDLLGIIKNGKLFSFYDIVFAKSQAGGYFGLKTVSYGANYNILIYLALSIWLLPVKTLGHLFHFVPSPLFLDMYSKQFVLIMLLIDGYVLYKLALKFGLSKSRAKWAAFLFLSSPILLYGSTAFGQLDVISIFLTLLSLLFYLDKKYIKFALIMCVAICFKVFALIIFVPLLLLVEKRIIHLMKYGAIGVSLLLITRLLAALDPGYTPTHVAMEDLYHFSGRIFSIVLPSSMDSVSLFLFTIIIICVVCYMAKPTEENRKYWVVIIPLVTYGAFFGFVFWHPQWVCIIYPYIALCIMLITNFKTAILIDCGINAGFFLSIESRWENNSHIGMINGGLLPKIFNKKLDIINTYEVVSKQKLPYTVITNTVFMACLFAFVCMIVYSLFIAKQRSLDKQPPVLERGLIWIRMSIFTFLLLAPSIFLFFWHK